MAARVITGDCRDVLPTLPERSVHVCVTSPPYFGLRSYLPDGHADKSREIGAERLHDCAGWATGERCGACFVCHLVEVFRGVWRVLRDDGLLFIVIGDSYSSGARGALGYGNGDTEGSGSPNRGSFSRSPDDGRTDDRSSRIPDSAPRRVREQVGGLLTRSRASMEALLAHLPSGDSPDQRPTGQSLDATRDLVRTAIRAAEPLLAALESNCLATSGPHPAPVALGSTVEACLWSLRSFVDGARAFAGTSDGASETPRCTADTASLCEELERRTRCTLACCSPLSAWLDHPSCQPQRTMPPAKNLLMVPSRLALALQADGWYLRMENVWHKRSCMPESVTDRTTRAHEMVYVFSKRSSYYYDSIAVQEASEGPGRIPGGNHKVDASRNDFSRDMTIPVAATRNLRSVWSLSPEPYADAHFAVYPTEIPKRAILAGTSEKGCCAACGAPWRRVVERGEFVPSNGRGGPVHSKAYGRRTADNLDDLGAASGEVGNGFGAYQKQTTGWAATCSCDAGPPVPCVVLDCFSGAGTTGLVADRLGRDYIGVELNAEYVAMSKTRIVGDAPLFANVAD